MTLQNFTHRNPKYTVYFGVWQNRVKRMSHKYIYVENIYDYLPKYIYAKSNICNIWFKGVDPKPGTRLLYFIRLQRVYSIFICIQGTGNLQSIIQFDVESLLRHLTSILAIEGCVECVYSKYMVVMFSQQKIAAVQQNRSLLTSAPCFL